MNNEQTETENGRPEPAVESLLCDVNYLINRRRAEQELAAMDRFIAEVMTLEEYNQCLRYKQVCLEQLDGEQPGSGWRVRAAIEQGFVLGYWLAAQKFGPKEA